MKIGVHLYPDYVSLKSASVRSEELFQLLQDRGVELEAKYRWDGEFERLPTDEPVIVRWSSMMTCDKDEFIEKCVDAGHLVFYEGHVFSRGRSSAIQAVEDFLERLTQSRQDKSS